MREIMIILVVFLSVLVWLFYLMIKQSKENEQKKAEIKRRNDALRKEHEKWMRQKEEERKARELEQEQIKKEQERRKTERDTAYQTMVNSIRAVPVVAAEEKSKKVAISFLNTLKYSTITVRSNMEMLGNYVVIDTETTGLKCVSDEIIEIAAIRFQGFEPVEKFTTLLAPSKPIPERITEINHITNEMVADKPCFQQIAPALVEFIGSDNLVGYNLPFDLKFIVHYGANVTVIPRKYYDTLDLARKTVRGLDNYQLLTVCVSLGIPGATYKTLHRAEADALATGLLYQKIIDLRMERK